MAINKNLRKGGVKQTLPRAIQEETDPEWRAWFLDVERKRKALADPKGRPLVFSIADKDGEQVKIFRRQTEPKKIKSLIRREDTKTGRKLSLDTTGIEEAWQKAAGPELASASSMYSFKNGVLTISIFSSPLLQEVRQFRQVELLRNLHQHWPASMTLVRIQYRLGKK